jgi:hypothetical protein
MPTNQDMRNTPAGLDEDDEDADDPESALEDEFDPEEYDVLLRLERLESVEEELMELGVTTLEEVRQRIADLHRELDAQEKAK